MGILVLAGTIFLLSTGFFSLKKSINIAAGINGIWWALFIIMAFVFYDTSSWNFMGMLYIEAVCACALLGSEVGRRLKYANRNVTVKTDSNPDDRKIGNVAWLMLLGIIVLAFLGQLLSLRGYGYSLRDFSNAEAYISMNTDIAYARYNAPVGVGTITQIFLMFAYIGPLCGGYSFVYADKLRCYIISILTLIPIIFGMMFTNTKAGFVASVMLFISGFLVAYLEKKHCFPNISFKMIALLIVLGSALFIALFIVMCIRVGDFSIQTILIIKDKFIEYAIGQMQAFELWFEHIRPEERGLELGINTFLAIADKLGLKIKIQGVYELIDGASSNIFTAIRGVITDFGLVGGWLFYMIIGALGGICEKRVKNNHGIISITLMASILFFYFHGIIGSPWVYTLYMLPFVCFYIFCYFSKYNIKCQETKFIVGRTYVKKIKEK